MNRIFTAIKAWYDNHFTKFLGFAVFALATGDVTNYAAPIRALIGEKHYQMLIIGAGLATLYRGFENSQKKQP